MFEKIILRRSETGMPLSLGEIAQALLFYQNVHIIFDRGILIELVKNIGFDGVLSFLSRPHVSGVYIEEMLVTHTNTYAGTLQHHSFQTMYVSGDQDVGNINTKHERLEYAIQKAGFDKKLAHRFVSKFRQTVPFKSLSDNYFSEVGIVKSATEDLDDKDFIQEAIKRVLSSNIGVENIAKDFKFEVMKNPTGFYVFTNIDFKAINEKRNYLSPELGNLTEAGLVNEILLARAETSLAAHYGGEFYTSNLSSQIIRLKHKELLKKMGIDTEEIKQWQEIVIPESPSIKEVINANERTFSDFLKLLDKSQKFRDWAQSVNPDEKLVIAYLREVTSEGWVDKLPAKAIRYLLGATIDLSHPVLGKVFSVADTFLLDKLLKGWRPNHFVDKQLKPFINPKG